MRSRQVPAWLPLYVVLVLGVTLSPPFLQCIAAPIGIAWRLWDLAQNAVLFLPLGIALRRLPWWAATATALVLSGSIEFSQRWMLRDPNAADILGNLIGAQLGRILPPLPRLRVGRRVAAASFALAGLVPLGVGISSAPREDISDFSNWEPFPLALGNEPVSINRAWPGVIGDVSIFDRAVGSREIAGWTAAGDARPWSEGGPIFTARLAAPPEGRIDGPDGPARFSLAPPAQARVLPHGFSTDGTPWVLPDRVASHVRERLMASGQMSVRARIRAGDLGHRAPGRIVTLSRIPGSRDFTLAQWGRNLQFRVRTPGNGGNGDRVTAMTRGGPVDHASHEVWGVFDGDVARIFVDGACWGDALVAATRVRNRVGRTIVSLIVAATAFTGLAAATLVGGPLRRMRIVCLVAGSAAWLSLFWVGVWRPFPDFDLPALLLCALSLAASMPILRRRAAAETPGRPPGTGLGRAPRA